MWRKYERKNVISLLSQEEYTVFTQSFSDESAMNDVADVIIEANTALIRGYLRQSKTVRMSKDVTLLPLSLFNAMGVLCRYDILSRFPLSMTEERRKQRDDVIALLKDIAENKFIPESIGEDEEEREEEQKTKRPNPRMNADRFRKLDADWY